MRGLIFVLVLCCAFTGLQTQVLADEAVTIGAALCNCPPDCDCKQPGGTCPKDGPCVEGCRCDEDQIDGHGLWVHPAQKKTIERNEALKQGLRLAWGGNDESIVVNGERYFTGYHPTWSQYYGAKVERIGVWDGPRGDEPLPAKYDLRTMGESLVRHQQCGDCWAQGAVSAFEMNVSSADKASRMFSVQDVIDCSGYGSCGGGQLSVGHFLKGAALESDYPYMGRDGRCRAGVTRQEKALEAPYIRGASGKLPNQEELQRAVLQYGAMEVCGSSGALGSGGRQDTPRGGYTDHCYALYGWLDGKSLGWQDDVYWIIKNSWGTGWGDKGYGYYRLAPGGGSLRGAVITEIQAPKYKPIRPPEPVLFDLDLEGVSLKITILPNETKWNRKTLSEAIEAAVKDLEGSL